MDAPDRARLRRVAVLGTGFHGEYLGAVEAALQINEKQEPGETVVIAVGVPACRTLLSC